LIRSIISIKAESLTGDSFKHYKAIDRGLRYSLERHNQAPARCDIDHFGGRQQSTDCVVSSSDRHGGGALLHA